MILYVMVTRDKYELPIAVANSGRELSKMLGLRPDSVTQYISRVRRGVTKGKPRYIRVEVDDDDED